MEEKISITVAGDVMDTVSPDLSVRNKSKPGRMNGRNSSHKSVHKIPTRCSDEIFMILQANQDKGAHKDKKVGYETQEKRATVVRGFFRDLFMLGYRIESVHNLRRKAFACCLLLPGGSESVSFYNSEQDFNHALVL